MEENMSYLTKLSLRFSFYQPLPSPVSALQTNGRPVLYGTIAKQWISCTLIPWAKKT